MRLRHGSYALVGLFVASGMVRAGEAFRCGPWIITDELSVAELKAKCGEPKSKDSETVEVRGKAGTGSVARGTTTIEHWTYEFTSGASRYLVTIVDGKIKSIERTR
jgi:hypothetical protein